MAGNPFIGNPGPQFDPDDTPPVEQPITDAEQTLLEAGWDPARVRRIVRVQGIGTHELIGVGEEDWLWRESELELLAPALAGALNRYPVTQAAAAVSDELTAGAVFIEYSLRSIRERSRVLKARKAAEEAPKHARGAPGVVRPDSLHFDTGVRPEDLNGQPAAPAASMPPTGNTPETWRVPE